MRVQLAEFVIDGDTEGLEGSQLPDPAPARISCTAPRTISASLIVRRIGRQCCTAAIARATRRAKTAEITDQLGELALAQGRNQIRETRSACFSRPVSRRRSAFGERPS